MIMSSIRAIEEHAFAAWPALETHVREGWLLRLSDGYTKRANSANALAPEGTVERVREAVEAFYRDHGQPVIFRVTPLAPPGTDGALAAASYAHLDDTLVMTLTLPKAPPEPDGAVTLLDRPGPEWCDGFADANNVPGASRPVHDRLLAGIVPAAAFAVLRDAGAPVAYGLAVADKGLLGLFDIVTVPDARRRGHADRLIRALMAWGVGQGAHTAYLQVVEANEKARALYHRLGFEDAYRYHYRMHR